MHFLNYHYNNIIKYDFLNKYSNHKKLQVPKIKKICLTFTKSNIELKELFSALFALEFISKQKGIISKSNKPQIALKIKKGEFVSCRLILRKKKMYSFLEKLFYNIFPKIKQFDGFVFKVNKSKNSLDFILSKLFYFSELELHYRFFQKLPPMQVTIVTTSKNSLHTFFLLIAFRFPLQI
jgi:large subunit ribosomal protein L5